MKKLIFTIAIAAITQCSALAQNLEWARRIGGNSATQGKSIATDAYGNIYTAGHFRENCDFNPGVEEFNLTSAGNTDIFIQKMDASGNFLWVKRIGSISEDIANAIAVDSEGNVFATGSFMGTVDFNPGAGEFNLTSTGDMEGYLLKLDTDGNFLWVKRMGGASADTGLGITIDMNGNVCATGYFGQFLMDFGPEEDEFFLGSAGISDIFVVKYDTEGTRLWAVKAGGGNDDMGLDITTDTEGNVYTTGLFRSSADFNPGPLSEYYELNAHGDNDIFIWKLDVDGNFVWAKRMGGNESDGGVSIAIDESGNLYTTGFFRQTAYLNPDDETAETISSGESDIFVHKLNADGSFAWVKQMGSTQYDGGKSIVVDNSSLYVTGSFYGTVDFNPGVNTNNLTSSGYSDGYILKLDTDGNFSWVTKIGANYNDDVVDIAIDLNGNVLSTGSFFGTIDFNPGPEVNNLTSSGGTDTFIIKLNPDILSVNDDETDIGLSIYPNPISSHLFIQSEYPIQSISIYNQLGELLQTETRNSFSVEHLPAGVYMVQIQTKKGMTTTRMIKE